MYAIYLVVYGPVATTVPVAKFITNTAMSALTAEGWIEQTDPRELAKTMRIHEFCQNRYGPDCLYCLQKEKIN